MRIVLDTTVIVAALRSDAGASRRLVVAALERRFQLLLSVPLIIEYEAVVTRREHLAAAGLKHAEVASVLDALAAVSEPVVPSFRWRPMLRDPNDDMVFEVAFNGRADLLATFNKRDFESLAAKWNVQTVSPAEALRFLEDSHAKK